MREREHERERREHDEKVELERREHEEAVERENREQEAREARAVREHEMEMTSLRGDNAAATAGQAIAPAMHAKSLRLPEFKEKTDQIDAYIERYERFAKGQLWKPEVWATNLSTLLTGKALDVYSRILAADALDYKKLREALQKAYQLTLDGFRTKFWQAKCEVSETPTQFVVRLYVYLSRWAELAEGEDSYTKLFELFLK